MKSAFNPERRILTIDMPAACRYFGDMDIGDSISAPLASALRKLIIAALCGVILGLAACSGAAGSSSGTPPRQGLVLRNVGFPLHIIRFPSGLRVIAERDERMPLVAVALVVGAGSSSDPPGKEGLAHYVEHLAFRSRPSGK